MKKKLHDLKKGDKVKLKHPNGSKFIGTVVSVDLPDGSFVVAESPFDHYHKSVEVIEPSNENSFSEKVLKKAEAENEYFGDLADELVENFGK